MPPGWTGTNTTGVDPRAINWGMSGPPWYSQGHQDDVIADLLAKVGTTNKFYVEFGFNMPTHCSGSGPNTCKLWLQNWQGLLMDGDHENSTINLHKEFVYPHNVVSLFDKYNVPKEPDFVTIDIDSVDVYVLDALLNSSYRPRLMTAEYNPNYQYPNALAFPDTTRAKIGDELQMWDGWTCYAGSSAGAIEAVAHAHDYVVVGIAVGMDLFLMPKELAAKHNVPELDLSKEEFPQAGKQWAQIRPMKKQQIEALVDISVLNNATGAGMPYEAAHAKAREAAVKQTTELANKGSKCFSAMLGQ
jgi:hypothetical protein